VRIRSALIVSLITVVGLTTISVIGQEEPLPAVSPREIVFSEPTVFLAAEPIVQAHAPSLFEAARLNDYASFDTLYRAAKRRGEQVAQFDTLHELWTWAINDPIGAFYGPDVYARFDRAYPGYARYINDYRIVDSHGNAFYPTSETRTFLLDRIAEGNAPRVLIAQTTSDASPAATTAGGQAPSPVRALAPTAAAPRHAVHHQRVAAHHARTTPKQVPATTPAVATTAPAVAATTPIVTPAAVPAATIPAPAPVAAAPVAVTTVPALTPAPAPAVASSETPAKPVAADDSGSASRGLLLLVIGIIGIGLLAVMLRTPREAGPVSILKTQEPAAPTEAPKPEPLRRAPAEPQEGEKTTRATGSHG
jgi:hypothetical protein